MEQTLAPADAPETVAVRRKRPSRSRAGAPGVSSLAAMQRIAGASFLVVDPSDAMRAVLAAFLASLGARRIEMACGADEAAQRLCAAPADVVLCEYRLGDGPNGQQLLEEARHQGWIGPATVWLMVSAERRSEMVSGAAELGPDEYLVKPVTEQALEARLLRLVERKAGLAEIAAALRGNDHERALTLCEQRLQAGDEGRLDVLRLQAQAYEAMGRPERAVTLYEGILREREVGWAQLALAKLHWRAYNLPEAVRLLKELIARFPRYVQAYDCLAQLYEEVGDDSAAGLPLRLLQRAARISPNSPARQSALGAAALRGGAHDLALQAFSNSIRLAEHSPRKDPAAHLGLARACLASGRPQQALDALSLRATTADTPAARLAMKAEEARAQQLLGNAAAAQAAAQAAQALAVDNAAQVSIAQVLDAAKTLMAAGQLAVVTPLLQFVARNHFDDPGLIAQAHAVFQAAGMGEQGRTLLEASRQQATEAMSEGVGLLAQGALTQAVESLRKARQLMPRNPRVLMNHAYAIIALIEHRGRQAGLEHEAQASISAAAALAPGEPRVAELQQRLRRIAG